MKEKRRGVATATARKKQKYVADEQEQPQQIDDDGNVTSSLTGASHSSTVAIDYSLLVEHVSTFLNSRSSSASSSSSHPEAPPAPAAAATAISYLVDFLSSSSSSDDSVNRDESDNYFPTNGNSANITKQDVASILLPWSISRLLARVEVEGEDVVDNTCIIDEDDYGGGEEEEEDNDDINTTDYMHLLEWNALSCCLDVLDATVTTTVAVSLSPTLKKSDDYDDNDDAKMVVEAEGGSNNNTGSKDEGKQDVGSMLISSNLSQNMLNRLLPRAVRVALTSTRRTSVGSMARRHNNWETKMADAASNVYIHLVQHGTYYRPTTLEVACQTLLCLVDKYSVLLSYQQPQLQQERYSRQWTIRTARIRNATLSMVRMLVDTATNHKRVFSTISSTEVLPILGRWIRTVLADSTTDDAQHQQTTIIISDILQKGLYNIDISMDGYRSAIVRLDEEVRASGKDTTATATEAGAGATTTTKKDKWICFQSSLFASIQSLVCPPDTMNCPPPPSVHQHIDHPTKAGKQNDVIVAVVGILPLITLGFFDRVVLQLPMPNRYKHQQQMSPSKDGPPLSTTIERDAILQFRFWRHIISPVVNQLSSTFTGDNASQQKSFLRALLGAITETLELVLKYDAYSPSYTDVGDENVWFLEQVTNCLMNCWSRRSMRCGDESYDVDVDDGSIDELILTSLQCILSLNHRLLHDRLADVIYFACSCLQTSSSPPALPADAAPDVSAYDDGINALPSSSKTTKMKNKGQVAKHILSEIVKTYRELRQVGYFLTSTRGAFVSAAAEASRRGCDIQPLIAKVTLMLRFGSCTNLTDDLVLAYQTCPSGQISEIWNFFTTWISGSIVPEGENEKEEGENGNDGDTTSANDDIDNNKLRKSVASSCMEEHAFAVRMFIMFIQNIRAGKQNSAELRGLCKTTMSTSVSKFLIGTKSGANRRVDCNDDNPHELLTNFKQKGFASSDQEDIMRLRHGFDLCGWLIDLHTRCCFWADSSDAHNDSPGSAFLLSNNDNDCSNDVLSSLRTVAKTTLSTQQFKSWRSNWITKYWQDGASGFSSNGFCHDIGIPASLHGSFQRLALHRIHQLHSMIYYCNLQESELHVSERNLHFGNATSLVLTNEARMLVDFSIYLACSQLIRRCITSVMDASFSESLWAPMAQSLCIWTRYSDVFHIELFLIWFFDRLCQRHCLEPTADQVFRLEKNIALTLARDASFYDIGDVMSLFMQVGIKFANSRFLDSIVTAGKASKMKILDYNFGSTKLCLELAEKDGTKLARVNHLDGVSTTLAFLASAPIELTLCNENVKLIDKVEGLNILSLHVINQGVDSQDPDSLQILNIIRSSMSLISNLLPKALLISSDSEAPCLTNLACLLFKNCLDFGSDEDVVSTSCNAISEYFTLCIDYYERNTDLLVGLLSQLGTLIHDVDVDFSPKASIVRSVIRRMNILDRHHALSKNNASSNPSMYSLCLQFVLDTQKAIQLIDFEYILKMGHDSEHDTVAAKSLLLESEVYSFIGSQIVATSDSILLSKDRVENAVLRVGNIIRSISCAQESPRSLAFTNAVDYFLSAMSAGPGFFLRCAPPTELIDKILEASSQSFARDRESTCLDAALCSLLRAPGIEQTKSAIHYLLNKSSGCKRVESAFITKSFHLLITCANSQEQNAHLSHSCADFISISMGLLRDRQCAIAELASNVKLFSKTLTTLISKKELLLLSGREISMFCCEMNPILADSGVNKHDANANDSIVSIYISCCSAVASLIAHYPKQLYGCPSPLFSLMLALLSNVLRTSGKNVASHKAQEYAKICELLIPHKDIFKKHVVGLIIHYIWSLKKGMNPTIKSKLMPSIFALLDMLSDFETRQIDAMIDAPSKALFAPVFRSYQKYYQYHGQA